MTTGKPIKERIDIKQLDSRMFRIYLISPYVKIHVYTKFENSIYRSMINLLSLPKKEILNDK